jgi:hypothetical protein
MLENGFNLGSSDTRKPFKEVVNRRSVFKILK